LISKNTTILSLTGGLGNQLFQLAAGLNTVDGDPLLVDWKLAKPRLTVDAQPELKSFILPSNVSFYSTGKYSWLISKATGYMLRMGIGPRSYERIPGYSSLARFAASILISFHFKRACAVFFATDVGFFNLSKSAKGNYLVGYFQSYKWSIESKTLKELRGIRLVDESMEVVKFRELSLIERPLVVHIRLGDYKYEESIGLLPASYYIDSIERLWSTGKYNKIWAFSDEPKIAATILSELPSDNIRWILEVEGSASKTLEVMRYGYGYVISNSTFSWWGAYISHNFNGDVIAPRTWFRDAPAPSHLIPPHWETEITW
jgi:hypothetical protein